MRIAKLTTSALTPVEAVAVANKHDKEKLYFNVKHGTKGKSDVFWVYSCGVSTECAKPSSLEDICSLDKDNYILKQIRVKGKVLKDRNDNALYNIHSDNNLCHKRDLIVFWEIPNKYYHDVTFDIKGDVKLLGSGKTGYVRDDIQYISPAPVLEIYGNASLTWRAIDLENRIIAQKIEFVNGDPIINKIETEYLKEDVICQA